MFANYLTSPLQQLACSTYSGRSVDPCGTTYNKYTKCINLLQKSDGVFNVCDGGSHSTFIAPPDTIRPLMNPGWTIFNWCRIKGLNGAVSFCKEPVWYKTSISMIYCLSACFINLSHNHCFTLEVFTNSSFFSLEMVFEKYYIVAKASATPWFMIRS